MNREMAIGIVQLIEQRLRAVAQLLSESSEDRLNEYGKTLTKKLAALPDNWGERGQFVHVLFAEVFVYLKGEQSDEAKMIHQKLSFLSNRANQSDKSDRPA